MVEKSDRMWSTGEGNGKPLQYSCLENPMNSMKRQNDRILREELPRSVGAQYATGDQWRNNSRKNEGMEPKQKEYPAMDVTGDRSKVQCCKQQYCIGTWNVRSMNQGKLEVVKQEMARVNVDILGISKLKWTGMGEFNSDDHYIYYCGQESPQKKWSSHHGQQRSLKCSTWMQSQKWQNDLCSFPRQTIIYIYIYIYFFFFFPVLVLCCCVGFSLSCHKWRVFSSGTRASHCDVFSCGAWAVGSVDFSSCGSQALEHRLSNVVHRVSCSSVCRIFPDSGSNLCLVRWQVDCLPLSHMGSPRMCIFV